MYYGGGKNDPTKHDANFLVGFLDYVAQRGAVALSGWGGYDAGPAAKRQRMTPPGGGAYATSNYGPRPGMSGDASKDALVARIKAFQRSGEEAKEQWWMHC